MSMISHQCDELRRMAEQTDWEIPEAAMLMRQAADTIWELRNKLADMVDQREELERLKAESEMPRYDGMDYEELVTAAQFSWMENAKLRVERDEWHRVAKNKQDIIDHMRDARAENAKLRELVRKWYPHMLRRVGRDALEQWGQLDVLRELGEEVTAR